LLVILIKQVLNPGKEFDAFADIIAASEINTGPTIERGVIRVALFTIVTNQSTAGERTIRIKGKRYIATMFWNTEKLVPIAIFGIDVGIVGCDSEPICELIAALDFKAL
jgi:hypothetical protein